MKLLLDECLSRSWPPCSSTAGTTWPPWLVFGMCGATDSEVFAVAAEQNRLLVTLDTDFGGLLASSAATAPSVLLIRRADHRPYAIAAVVDDVLASSSDALLNGALAVAGQRTVRLRELPLA